MIISSEKIYNFVQNKYKCLFKHILLYIINLIKVHCSETKKMLNTAGNKLLKIPIFKSNINIRLHF